jgi:AmiR/NasT family two-component response regulator
MIRHTRGIRVLLAEDDMAVARGFELLLRRAGYEVVGVAQDGAEAVDMAQAANPDLILMDIRMPRMDGLDASRAISSIFSPGFMPIVLVTAHADTQLVRRAKNCGVLGYLVKPVNVEDLVPAIELAHSTAERINALEGVVTNLSEELESRKLIERAKGILMKHMELDEEQAMRMMQRESRRNRIKLKMLATSIIKSYDAGQSRVQ